MLRGNISLAFTDVKFKNQFPIKKSKLEECIASIRKTSDEELKLFLNNQLLSGEKISHKRNLYEGYLATNIDTIRNDNIKAILSLEYSLEELTKVSI